jgi:hypothetical protein
MASTLEGKVTIGEGDQAKEVEFFVKRPNNEVLKNADRHKSKVWNQAIQDGVLTKKELSLVMKKRGVWDDSKDAEEKKISREIADLEKTLYHGNGKGRPKLSEGRKLAIEIRRKRIALRVLITEKINMEENTADSLSDNARFDYIVAHCTFHKNGQPVYKDFEDYNQRSADELAFSAASLLSRMLYNLDASFEKNLPENKFLSKFKLVNDDLSLIDPNNPEHLIDTEGRRIDENGNYLDTNGSRVDRDGNPLDKDGDYELADYENDLLLTPSPVAVEATAVEATAEETVAEEAPVEEQQSE